MKTSTDLRFIVGSSILLMIFITAFCAPFWTGDSPSQMDITQRLLPPSSGHWLGTDLRGIDVWASVLFGARISLTISFVTVFISTFLGSTLGLLAGFYGGWFEQVLMRLIDVLMAFPGMILSLALTTLLAPTYMSLVLAISITGWIGSARLIRAETLSLREREYVLAAHALGAAPRNLIFQHLLPALFPLIFTHMATSISGIILLESGLSFLGLGPKGNFPTWGQLLNEGRTVIIESPLLTIAPGSAIFLLILSVNLIGDSLRDRFDPKQGRI